MDELIQEEAVRDILCSLGWGIKDKRPSIPQYYQRDRM